MFTPRIMTVLLAVLLSTASTLTQAAFAIVGTRVVYEEAHGETNVRVRYTVGDVPALMQAWLDDGTPQSQPGAQSMPFILTPAVAHMNPGAEQIIRVIRIAPLPTDQESLFFLNVLEINAENDEQTEGQNAMQLNMQARLKFFYRPRGLKPSAEQAVDQLRFSVEQADGAARVRITNPTPYHITLTEVSLHASEAPDTPAVAALDDSREYGPMVAPHSDLLVYIKSDAQDARLPGQAQVVRYTIVNDHGGFIKKQGKLG